MFDQLGVTDMPVAEDSFGIESFVDGLSTFVKQCATPMAIAIQGAEGAGRTSVMWMINNKINPESSLYDKPDSTADCQTLYFNPWEFAQFDHEDNIAGIMIQQLCNMLADKNRTSEESVGRAFDRVLKIGTGYLSGGIGNEQRREELNQIRNLRNEFQLLVNKKLGLVESTYRLKNDYEQDYIELNKSDSKKRIVFFIDDLDKLEPAKAVEILEFFKNFVECKNCVFIVAVNFDTLRRGVAVKYKLDKDDQDFDLRAKNFFDKVIQASVNMPTEKYNVTEYIRELLNAVTLNGEVVMKTEEDFKTCEKLLRASVGTNPRRIKKVINSYQLITLMDASSKDIDFRESRILIFGVLCLKEIGYEQGSKRYKKFSDLLTDIIDTDSSGHTDYNEMKAFLNIKNR